MKNILLITDYMAKYEGNFICSIKALEKKVTKEKGNFFWLFSKDAKEIEWVNKINNLNFLENNILKNVISLNKFIKKNKIDIVYSHFCLPKTQLVIKIVRLLNPNIKLYQHFHNHYESNKNTIKNVIIKKIFDGDLNIGCSEDVAKSLPYKKEKCIYIENAIDFSRLDVFENFKIADENKFVILMFGYTYERKGVDLAIKAIKELNDNDIILAISVSKNLDEFKQKIIAEFGSIPEFVKILEPRNDIATYYKASDLFLSSSREEGLCYSLLEVSYCTLPILASNIPGHVSDIPGEYFFEKENYIELKEKIKFIKKNRKNKELLKKLDDAKLYVIQKYDINNWVEKINKYFNEE
jgi:glycosyltransferase involved in cell wall biosynthesis